MITLKISFLLALTPQNNEIIVKKKSKRKPKKEKSKKSKSKSKSTKSKKQKSKQNVSKKETREKIEDPNYSTIMVEKPISYVHIDYDFFGKKFKYSTDIVCWGPVAKIFTKSGERSWKTITMNDQIWIPVFLEHYLDLIPTEEIRKMLHDVITVNVKIGKNFVGAKAKAEKSSVFYLNLLESTDQLFSEVYSKKPENETESIRQEIRRLLEKLLTYPINQEILTWIYNIDDLHIYKIKNILSKRQKGDEILSKNFYEEEPQNDTKKTNKKKSKKDKKSNTSKKSKTTKSSKKSKKKRQKNQNFDLKIPAYILLSDPKIAVYQFKPEEGSLHELYILLSSQDILSVAQKLELCPMVVKIWKISDLPFKILQNNGIQKVFASCDVPGLLQFKTKSKPINQKIVFDESRIIICNDFPDIKILELLQTRKVLVEIYGVKENLTITEKNLQKSPTSENLLLAKADFDLSSLAINFNQFKEKSQCYNNLHSSLDLQHLKENFFVDRFTVNETHFAHFVKPEHNEILPNSCLVENGTTLKLEAKFFTDAYNLNYMKHDNGKSFKRLLIIFFKENEAKEVLTEILQHNYDFRERNVLFSNLFLLKKQLQVEDYFVDIISGFFLDQKNLFILFVEGVSNGYILNVLYRISRLDITTARVFYNSKYNFEERLYKLFYSENGLLYILMKISFNDILSKQKFYVQGNVPYRCFRAVQKFNLILNSNSFKSILNHDLLPTEIEFLSFLIEYGLQVQYKEQEENFYNQIEE